MSIPDEPDVPNTNFLADMISEEAANGLWAKTDALTEAEVTALIDRQRAIRDHLNKRADSWDEDE